MCSVASFHIYTCTCILGGDGWHAARQEGDMRFASGAEMGGACLIGDGLIQL